MKLLTSITIFVFCFCCKNPLSKEPNDPNPGLIVFAFLGNQSTYNWNLPAGFPTPRTPEDNPMSEAKVNLGRFLFYDRALSGNNTMSCASCHLQRLAFTDGKVVPSGITNQVHPRNSMGLFNVAYNVRQTWNNSLLVTLEQQAVIPLFGESPVELGLFITEPEIRARLLQKPGVNYESLFRSAFPGEAEPIRVQTIARAISSFQRSIISGNSAFDRFTYSRESSALTASQQRGLNFFNSEIAECFHCHDGVNFNDSTFHENTSPKVEPLFHNNAIYATPLANNKGLNEVTGNASDLGRFRTPSLRNLKFTFPYMHDGSFGCADSKNPNTEVGRANGATLEGCAREALGKVIDSYARGGNRSTCGLDNANFPCLSTITPSTVDTTLIRNFPITAQEKEDLVNFLLSLSDDSFVTNPKFSNPFPR